MVRLIARVLLGLGVCNGCWADVAVIAHPSFSSDLLSVAEVQRYYLKRKLLSPQGDLVLAGALPAHSPATATFNRSILEMDENRLLAYWAQKVFSGNAKPPRVLEDAEALKYWVSTTPNALGYIDIMDVDDCVKVLLTVAQEP